jgi:putative FmdB family regulatory protein
MPIYEYRCPNGHVFELLQPIGDPAPDVCEVCNEGPVERVLYPVAVHFKGSGFYTTDYGRGSRKKEPSQDGSSGEGESKPPKEEKKKAAEA